MMEEIPGKVHDEIIVSAPGKVILHGEHAVVYGKTALAASLSLRSYLHLTNRYDDTVSLNLPNIGIYKAWKKESLMKCRDIVRGDRSKSPQPTDEIIEELKKVAKVDDDMKESTQLAIVVFIYFYLVLGNHYKSLPSIDVYVKSSIPVSAGLGSSASYCTCLAASLLLLFGHISEANESTGHWSFSNLRTINTWAFKGEEIIHGNPSGVDNSVTTHGGMLTFQSGFLDFLKDMPELKILLVNTKVPRSTKKLVEKVREKYNKYPDVFKPIMESIEFITTTCQVACTKLIGSPLQSSKMYDILEDMIDINQSHLSAMGVSHPDLDSICNICMKRKLHAKLTGAGGGGCAMCLIRPDTSSNTVVELKTELTGLKFDCLETTIGGAGLIRHFQLPAKFIEPDSIS